MIGVPIADFSKFSIRAYKCWTARYVSSMALVQAEAG